MNIRPALGDGDRGHDDAGSDAMTNAARAVSLTVEPAQDLGRVAVLQWPLAWAVVCVLIAVDVVWASQIGLTIGGAEIKVGLIGALLAMSVAYRHRNRGRANMLEALAWFFSFVAAAAVLSYVAASCALPLQDATMEWLDRAIGFDWSAWRDALLDRPTAYRLLVVTYNSLFSQFLLVVIYFCKRDMVARIEELMLLMVATLVPTVLISAIWPTLGPFAALAPNDSGFLQDLLELRAGGPLHFNLLALKGIIQMPSYHTALAVLYTYAFRGTGLIGWVVAAVNMVMLLAIPPVGGHYLVDVLAGGALAFGAIVVLRAARHGVSRILLGPWRETSIIKVLRPTH
ncbi:phosphatase PAP2 family protein [Bradyrhizobium sp. CCBAU 11386]|uniref:phosphatase PAP2 family protein n=1 Tax=Bradyrhizobium sp. CCBAU 11386 TaxID=1630837 RepID=UPI002303260B|nr:phosphatase PAP2 family protein [Bradyrhizobium sp. CCBAU 11386]